MARNFCVVPWCTVGIVFGLCVQLTLCIPAVVGCFSIGLADECVAPAYRHSLLELAARAGLCVAGDSPVVARRAVRLVDSGCVVAIRVGISCPVMHGSGFNDAAVRRWRQPASL